MVGQFYLERCFSRGASRKLTGQATRGAGRGADTGEAGHT